ncbi:MAG TPA: hypothetical protein VG937_18660 [Polyangiaceae bacterium]|nr:hypothetical protein [Polyangiaceae bacterium]
MRRDLVGWLSLLALAAPAPALAQSSEKEIELPRLGLDPAEPSVRSAPPALPFGVAPATSKEVVLDFHGYASLPLQIGIQKRDEPSPGESGTVLHTPAYVPQNYRRFQYTGVLPDPWIQLGLSYGNSLLAGTVILAAGAATEAESYYNPVKQLGVSDAYVTLNLSEKVGIPLQIRGGAMHNRYGSMGAFDAGRYGTPLIARINAIGETATAAFKAGPATVVLEQGIGGQLGRIPVGTAPEAWNDFGSQEAGASYVGHFHGGLSVAGRFQLGLHYITAWSQDDLGETQQLSSGHINVLGADARLTWGRFGHLYGGVAHTQAKNPRAVSGIIEVLNARGGEGLFNEYLGPRRDPNQTVAEAAQSPGDGSLTTFGFQYDLSIARAMFGDRYHGKNPDVLISAFGIGTSVSSDDYPDYDGVLKLKAGLEATYTMASWFGVSGRLDHVRQNHDFNRRSFTVYTGRLLFHTYWQSRDEFALSYSRFVYGREVYVEKGSPALDDPTASPDRDVLSLSATFWW